jgi:hypothetical protein
MADFIAKCQKNFENNFRKIASTSVGRVLLYRILIEIRRHVKDEDNTGCFATDILDTTQNDRNKARCLSIKWGHFEFDRNDSVIFFHNITDKMTIMGARTSQSVSIVSEKNTRIDISLFHELIHWYHLLRNEKRQDAEISNQFRLNTYPLGKYFWHDLLADVNGATAEQIAVSAKKWESRGALSFEEMRTILGVPCDKIIDNMNYLPGDDISENLYRMCIKVPLRFGHDNLEFREDCRVIDPATMACCSCGQPYGITHLTSCNENLNTQMQKLYKKEGLGRCIIFEYVK